MKKTSVIFLFISLFTLIFWGAGNFSQKSLFSSSSVTTFEYEYEDEDEVQDEVEGRSEGHESPFEIHLKSLPTLDDLENLIDEEVHFTPEIIKDGGEVIGRVHEEAEADPNKRVDALGFFKGCAEDDQLAPAIRAVCLNKTYKLIPEWGIPTPLNDSAITEEVVDLSMKLN